MDSLNDLAGPGQEPARKRLRASHACDACRAKKVRCNGNNPCAACDAARQECTYGSEANTRGKSDLILEGVLRVEKFLHEMKASMTLPPPPPPAPSPQDPYRRPVPSPAQHPARAASFSSSPRTELPHHQRTPLSDAAHWPVADNVNSLDNAVLASMHTSSTETVLQWPHFDVFPGLRDDYTSIFHLEQSRPPLRARPSSWHPFLSAREVDDILAAFGETVNFWYPTMTVSQLAAVRALMTGDGAAEADQDIGFCLALLTMALGLAGQVTAGLTSADATASAEDEERRAAKKAMADAYFDSALKRLHVVHTHIGSAATHCLFFIAMYFAFLRRPLQAWEYINASSAKCLLLLAYPPEHETEDDGERIRRIFWSCYILESDYLAELHALPQSGISQTESATPLPGEYETHTSPQKMELSSLYFLACISMRRLLNRVHHLLYARDSGTALNPARFPAVVRELDHQLEEWREVLPQAFAFSVGFNEVGAGSQATETEAGGFLRQRYLTCRSVIYRPYLMWMLSGMGPTTMAQSPGQLSVGREALRNCKMCLDACLLHILNLRGFGQTVLADTWICSLSMAGAMLMLLAACRVTDLRGLLGPEVLVAGEHLQTLLEGWQAFMGNPRSPSVEQSMKLIADADRLIKQVYRSQDHGPAVEIAGVAPKQPY